MPTKPAPQLKAWSYSRLSQWEKCPLLCKFKSIDRLEEPLGKALERGIAIHKDAELYSTGQVSSRPKSLDNFAEEFNTLRGRRGKLYTEQQIALTDKWEPTDWFGETAWVRAVIDCYFIENKKCTVIDYKTGKINLDALEQLGLYAIAIFATHEDVDEVDADLWFLDQGEIHGKIFTREHIPAVKRKWSKRATPMLKDQKFEAKPGSHCRWCHFRKSNGGPCVF